MSGTVAEFTGTDSGRIGGELWNPANRTRFTLLVAYPELEIGDFGDAEEAKLEQRLFLLGKLREAEFDASVVEQVGMYGGAVEPSLRVEVIVSLGSDPDAGNRLLTVAEEISVLWNQDRVWLVSEPVSLMQVGA